MQSLTEPPQNRLSFYLTIILTGLFILTGTCNNKNGSESQDNENPPSPSGVSVPSAAAAPKKPKTVLTSSLAGRWYDANPQVLQTELESYYQQAKAGTKEHMIALILPHAGYRYSGRTAMEGLKSLGGKKYQRVIVMGPSHSLPMRDILSVPEATHYKTPLGETPLDLNFIQQLKQYRLFQSILPAHQYEHSVQIEVPLLQYLLKDFQLVPIVTGTLSRKNVVRVGAILRSLMDENTLVIASSDFTHYGPRFPYEPFKGQNDIPGKVKQLDMGAYELIAERNTPGFLAYREKTGCTICGFMPIAILLSMLPAGTQTYRIHYDTSGDITGDWENSVSYFAIGFTGRWSKGPAVKPKKVSTTLTNEDKKALLQLARRSMEYYLKTKQPGTPEQLGISITEPMQQVRGTFVTLKCSLENLQKVFGREIKPKTDVPENPAEELVLRGCIGEIFPTQQLYSSVLLNAIKSAVADRRFPKVTAAECPQLHIEISVLTPPTVIASYEEIELGRQGIVLKKNNRSAVYLPQVAPEQGWNLTETLTHLSQKAGLPPDAWKEGAQFLVFEAEVFSEHDFSELTIPSPQKNSK